MELNKNDKNELRVKIEELLKKVPDGQRVKLDKSLLESLLFETVMVNKNSNEILKLPIWSGNFLKKLDLSEINFDNVSWCILSDPLSAKEMVDKDTYNKLSKISSEYRILFSKSDMNYFVEYDGTNANIDLSKSYEALACGIIDINDCNFSDLDFSKCDFSNIELIRVNGSDLSCTKLVLSNNLSFDAKYSILDDIDLSDGDYVIDGADFLRNMRWGDANHNFSGCSLINTKANIELDMDYVIKNNFKRELKEALEEAWDGCYINGKLFHNNYDSDEILGRKRRILDEYRIMKNNIFDSVTTTIDEQIKKLKKL